MDIPGMAAAFASPLSNEQRIRALEQSVSRLHQTVDGDVYNDTPSIRAELRLIRAEINTLRHDIETHNRRDMWIHVFQFVSEAVIITLLAVILFAAVTS